jgi:hypothetical protein
MRESRIDGSGRGRVVVRCRSWLQPWPTPHKLPHPVSALGGHLMQRLTELTQPRRATCQHFRESRALYVAAAQNHAHILVSHAPTLLQ